MISRVLLCLFAILTFSATAYAQNSPEIEIRGDDDLGDYVTDGLIIEHLGVSVDIRAGLAQITLDATLLNETDDEVEARFRYPLPAGSVINDYALDLEGILVDGVLIPKERAETLYTDRVTATVDPGIAARTSDNQYQTRIYPISANGGRRKIRLGFAAPVPAAGLQLPLSQSQKLAHVTINLRGDGVDRAETPISNQEAKDVTLSGDIFIPAVAAEPVISTISDKQLLTLPLAPHNQDRKQDVKSIAVIWDTSLSRNAESIATERYFVDQILKRIMPERQSLIHGSDRVHFAAPYQSPDQLSAALTRLSYDGATKLSSLLDHSALNRPDIQPDICLVITDGQSTIGARTIPNLPCRVFTYSADPNANRDWLALLATQNAGLDLSGLDLSQATKYISRNGGYQLAEGEIGEIVSAGARHWLLLDVSDVPRNLNLNFKDGQKSLDLRTLKRAPHRAAAAIWGQRQIARLRTQGPQSFNAILETARNWNVQTEETAFLVLENSQDYI